VHRDEPSIVTTPGGYARNASAREHVATDLALDMVRLLGSGAHVEAEPIQPGHVAVLVQTNRAAALVRDALGEAGIPAVINGAGSVFATPEGRHWLRLLEAIERPTSAVRAHAAALTPFLGWSAARIAGAADDEWEAVHRRLHDWARVLRTSGVASLLETITLAEGLPARVLAAVDGERRMTDLRHVGQLLHAAATTEQLGTTALVGWLRRRIAEAEQDTSDEDRSRRLESDAQAVQVLTVHRSKGLEFPIVYYPHLWEPGYIPPGLPVAYHDPEAGDRRTIDVGLEGPDFDRHKEQHLVEERGEDLRLAYVALTRAKHQAVLWWAPSFNSRESPLGRLLFARAADGTVPAVGRNTPGDAAAWARFEALAAEAPGCISVERSQLGRPESWSGPPRAPAELTAARFDRELDRRWRRTSFTDITSAAYDARVASEPEEALLADEPEAGVRPATSAARDPLQASPVILSEMPVGAEVGTFVHRVLEATDFAAGGLDAELAGRVAEVQARRAADIGDAATVVEGLRAAIETPLGDGLRLRDLARADRLDELDFEFPLVGGDEPTGRLALDAVAAVLRYHLGPDDPLSGYADRLSDPALRQAVRGYVTGSIDLVARAGGRFTVIDYKTNWLAAPGEELTAWHHRPAALAAEMERGHYGLQALLYLVALHRYLRWRLPDYDPAAHLGGVKYLFVRGMVGAETPVVDGTPCGVFAWQPPAALVVALSDALDLGVAA
jgi:exodeoxyribonuclease V beta subunit